MPDSSRPGWTRLLPLDPLPWLLESPEPAARWLTLTALCDRPDSDPEVHLAHAATLADPGTRRIVAGLPDWEDDAVTTGHNSPTFAPNMLGFLWHMGLRAGDDPAVEHILDQMLCHQDRDGRFQTYARWRSQGEPRWGALLCDNHAIASVLVRFGRAGDARVERALACIESDMAQTTTGLAWPCRPDDVTGFRGPGSKGDACPQVTLEALSVWAGLPEGKRPIAAVAAARSLCEVWRRRGQLKPYMFGHGRQFKRVKWPPIWYDAFAVVDALGRCPAVWEGPEAQAADRSAVAELAACLIAYNFCPEGLVTPQSCYRGFESHTWGQKKRPSAFATALLSSALRRLEPIADEIALVDIRQLGSSKGGSGVPVPPGWSGTLDTG